MIMTEVKKIIEIKRVNEIESAVEVKRITDLWSLCLHFWPRRVVRISNLCTSMDHSNLRLFCTILYMNSAQYASF